MPRQVSHALTEKTVNELWWMGIIQGTFAIFFGVTAIFWPGLTLLTLVYLFSAFIIALGISEIIHGIISVERRNTWWVTLLIGLVALGVGVYLVRHPAVSFGTFILIIGLTLIVRGILDIMRAFVDDVSTFSRALSVIIGLAALVAGVLVLFQPLAGGVAFVWIIGLYALIYGSLSIAIAFELRAELYELEHAAVTTVPRNGATERRTSERRGPGRRAAEGRARA